MPRKTLANPPAGIEDDRPTIAGRYAAELRDEAEEVGGPDALVASLAERQVNYRVAIRRAAAGVLQYSGHGYAEAGLEPYGPALEGDDLDGVRELARRLLDELDLLAARRTVDEVLDVVDAIDELGGLLTRDGFAAALLERRRARRGGAR